MRATYDCYGGQSIDYRPYQKLSAFVLLRLFLRICGLFDIDGIIGRFLIVKYQSSRLVARGHSLVVGFHDAEVLVGRSSFSARTAVVERAYCKLDVVLVSCTVYLRCAGQGHRVRAQGGGWHVGRGQNAQSPHCSTKGEHSREQTYTKHSYQAMNREACWTR
jgi:hypothetical protein